MTVDFVGRPFAEAEACLRAGGVDYATEITRPVRDFFKTDEKNLYVVRERQSPDGRLLLTLAGKQLRKEE